MCTVALFAACTLDIIQRGKSSLLTRNQIILEKFNLTNPLQILTQFAMNVSISISTTALFTKIKEHIINVNESHIND